MKKRALLDSIEVKTPCTQDWNKMYGNDEVRFCEHCVKHVYDLSAMTRKEAQEFAATAKGSICIRYVRRPDGKIQTAGDKLHQISGRASRLAASVFGASLTLASSAYAQENVQAELPERGAVIKVDKQTKDTPKEKTGDSIHGTVTDPNGAVIPGVTVTLTDKKSGTEQVVSSNEEGYYLFAGVAEGTYKLNFDPPGFRSMTIDNINFKGMIDAKYDAVLNLGEVMGAIVVRENYENQLVLAVQDNDIERIKQLIGQGVNVNEKDGNGGITALHIAVREGKAKIVEVLLNAGARVNVRDESRRTAIMMIAGDYDDDDNEDENAVNPAMEIFKLLIAHGAKVNLRDSQGMTALMYAAQKEAPELLRVLIAHKADINIQAKNGRTALMEAANEDETENVKVLLEAGADVNLKDDEGDTAMSLCADDDIERLLISYGTKQEEPQEEPDDN